MTSSLQLQRPSRRLLLSACALALIATPTAMAQSKSDYPNRPIRIIVPFGPGTSTDIVTRVLAEAMGRHLGQSLVVENKAGGGGSIGADLAARSPADGYTILMGTVGTHAINKALYSRLPYDPIKDFTPIALVGYTPTLLVVAGDSRLKSFKDLVEASKTPPGLNFGSAGSGTSGHLAGELLKIRTGGDMNHIPYKEGGLALSDVMSGQVDFMFYHPTAVMAHIKSGKMRALGVSSNKRSIAAPEVPSIEELIKSSFNLMPWWMLYTPATTPAAAVSRLREAANAALNNPEVLSKLQSQGLEKADTPSNALEKFAQDEITKWADLVRASGAVVN
jgi:tripartite-type tricarboxylate transporter receptor subunit TctC